MDVVAALVADAQPPLLVEPGDRALDDPGLSQSGTVPALRPRHPRLDVTAAQFAASFARVVGAVSVQAQRAATRSAAPSAHRRDRVDERNQLRDVVAVAASERDCKRRPATAGGQGGLEPLLERSTGLGPVFSPPKRPHVRAVDRRPRTSRSTPPPAASSARLRAAAARHRPSAITAADASRSSPSRSHLLRQVFPWDPRPQHEEDSGQPLRSSSRLRPG